MNEVKIRMLEAGITAWLSDPATVTYSQIARAVGMRHGSVFYHFPAKSLKKEIAEYAVKIKHSKLVPILVASGNPAVLSLTSDERKAFLQAVST